MPSSAIPIVIGVTGHRDLRAEELDTIRSLVTDQLKALMADYPNSSFWMLNSLAAGGDLLCAEIGDQLGIRLICPLPMEKKDYAASFQGEERARFEHYLAKSEAFVCTQSQEDRDACYRQAGLYVASHCHILLALWDGDETKKDGCGTAAAVHMARSGRPHQAFPCGSTVSILQVQVNRISGSANLPICARWLEEPDTQILSRTDRFNAAAASVAETAGYSLLPEECLTQSQLRRLEGLYHTADTLSVSFQKRHTGSLLAAAVCCVTLVLAYLMYDELDCRGFLLLYGGVMALYGLGCWLVTRLQFLEYYLQYRLLAETARVQCCVSALGYPDIVTESFTWTQKQDAAWVHCAIRAALIGPPVSGALSEEMARDIWIRDQLRYHTRAREKVEAKHRLNGRICLATLLGMIAAFGLTFLLEYGFPSFTTQYIICGLSPQSWMKVLWGAISAVTLFATDYFGKLSLPRRQIDHRKMMGLFQQADQAFAQCPQNRAQLFRKLAAEELIENGNWYSYSQESTLSFDL